MIIAEIGSNHESTLSSCIECIKKTKEVGADAVKFQMFSMHDLYGPGHSKECTKASIEPHWLPQLARVAAEEGIEFMCSGFSPMKYDKINRWVKTHKLASPENNHPEIIERLNSYGKPVIFSCGASRPADIGRALSFLPSCEVTLLYCVSAYPATEIRLEKITALRAHFPKYQMGLSDHTLDYTCAPVEAFRSYGAKVLEKHFNPLGLIHTPDAKVALKMGPFKTMVDRIKGPVKYDYLPEETESEALLKYNRRLIALKSIAVGDNIHKDDIGVYRSKKADQKGLCPFRLKDLLAKPASTRFTTGNPVHL
jgi:pseudaminic acid synthase